MQFFFYIYDLMAILDSGLLFWATLWSYRKTTMRVVVSR